jgi:hypothetical protein
MHSYQDELGFLMRFQQYELACNIKINIARKLEDLENSQAKKDNNYIVELYRLLQDTTELRLRRESELL